MAAGVSLPNPPAAQASPDAETREKGLRALRLELSEQSDPSGRALLLHEIARLAERRDDLAAAARDELAATKEAAAFVEPLEALIDIATRSRSKANLTKLLERLGKLSTQADDKERACVCLTATHAASGELSQARSTIEQGLEEQPTSSVLWLALETIAALDGDRALLLKAALGRAAYARNTQLRCLLLERVARLQFEQGDIESAFATLTQSAAELPSFRVLCAWEQLALRAGDFAQAVQAADQIATIIRAGLEEPEEQALYEIPSAELSEARAAAAQVRAVLYCLKLEDRGGALIQAEKLLDAAPESPLALSLCAALQKDQQLAHDFAETLGRLETAIPWSPPELGYLATLGALASARIEATETHKQFTARVRDVLPESRLAALVNWKQVEEGSSQDDLLQLVRSWGRAAPPHELAGYLLAESFLLLLAGQYDAALRRLSDFGTSSEPASSGHVSSSGQNTEKSRALRALNLALKRTLAETLADRQLERTTLLELYGFVQSEHDRESIRAELLRLELLDGVHETHLEELRAGTPWSDLLLGLASASSSKSIRELADSAVQSALTALENRPGAFQAGPAWRDALSALRVFLGTPLDELGNAGRDASEGILAGVRLGEALSSGNEQDLISLALAVNDESHRAAWLLAAFLRHIGRSEITAALGLLDEHPELGDADTESLFTWVSYREAGGDPARTLALFQSSELGAEDRTLDKICLERRFQPAEHLDLPGSEATPAEVLLAMLRSAVEAPELLDQLAGEQQILSDSAVAALRLAPLVPVDAEGELLKNSLLWAEAEPSVTAMLTLLMAARKAGDAETAATAIFRIAELKKSDDLLIYLDGRLLPPELESYRKTRLQELVQVQSPGTSLQAAWALAEDGESGAANSYAQLARLIDPKLEDPDAQLAQLSSGFEYLAERQFGEAIQVLEPLLDHLGADLTFCHALRIAAEHVGRYDLEARAICELARHAPDNRTSSEYWERAGLIYQDHLNDPVQAEICFNAALVRTPGSPTSFERVYRFARARKDRQHQVELIDARLDTAESETLRIELYWEKARFCRMLGKRAVASRALLELLALAPDHLPALALAAELNLVESKSAEAADALSRIARHPDTPDTERRRIGLFAADLFEQLQRPREAIELLQDLEGMGVTTLASIERKARAHARSGDWGEAYNAFARLNEELDTLAARLESARMMLAIQRDHLKQPEELKDAVRRVLRDDPDDADAVGVVLELRFSDDERRRLLQRPRESSRQALLTQPLNPPEIARFALLSEKCGEETLERISLGVLGLTGKLSSENSDRLSQFHERLPRCPTVPLSPADIEMSLAPTLWGAAGEFVALVSPYIAARIEPSLQALGVSDMMRVDEFSDHPLRHSVAAWMGALRLGDFELYIGGSDPTALRAIGAELPTLVVGKQVESPLSKVDYARLVTQLYGLVAGSPVLLNQAPDLTQEWLAAARLLAEPHAPPSGDHSIDEKVRLLSDTIPRATREKLTELQDEMTRAGLDIRHAPFALLHTGARAAALAYGEPSVLRKTPQLLPDDEEKRTEMIGEVIRFTLSDEFLSLRRKAGLEGA